MKVYLPNDSKMGVGGGWTFRRNLEKGASKIQGFEIVDDLEKADVSLIAGATMILPETFTKLKEKTKVVLRLDGIPEAWRNDGKTWGRFKHYFEEADGVICQSEFVKDTTYEWLSHVTEFRPFCSIVMNGVDKDVFKAEGSCCCFTTGYPVLNVNSRKDENKRIEEVIYHYRTRKLNDNKLHITFLGKYPTYLMENSFGLYDYKRGEDWEYAGIFEDEYKLAACLRGCEEFWFPSFADPCPNIVIEALHCGKVPKYVNGYGGTYEITKLFLAGYDFGLENMVGQYKDFFERL